MSKPVSVQCNLCGAIIHKSCDVKYEEKYHQDGSWLCSKCHKSERMWHNQDFSYNELVKHDKADTGRTPVGTKPIKTEMTSTQRRDNLNIIYNHAKLMHFYMLIYASQNTNTVFIFKILDYSNEENFMLSFFDLIPKFGQRTNKVINNEI